MVISPNARTAGSDVRLRLLGTKHKIIDKRSTYFNNKVYILNDGSEYWWDEQDINKITFKEVFNDLEEGEL